MAESSAQPSSSEASVEATKLNASGALATSPTTTQVQKPVDISERPILTPTLDSHDAFLEFCRLYAPYMQYPALTDREVRLKTLVGAVCVLTFDRLSGALSATSAPSSKAKRVKLYPQSRF